MMITYFAVAKLSPITIVEIAVLAAVVLGFVGYKIFKAVTKKAGLVNSTLTRDSYRIVELGKINDKYKFESLEKEYHFEYEVASKEELADFDYSETFYQLVKEKSFFFYDSCKKAEYNAKLMEKYQEAVDGIYFNKKILIGEASSKQVSLGAYKKYEKAHFQSLMYKPATDVMFYIDVKIKDDPKAKKASSVYTTEDAQEMVKRVEREQKQRAPR